MGLMEYMKLRSEYRRMGYTPKNPCWLKFTVEGLRFYLKGLAEGKIERYYIPECVMYGPNWELIR